MANIPFPAVAEIVSMSLQQLHIGDVTHRSIYTGAQQTLARAPARWTGFIEIAPTDGAGDADRKEIESWLIALRGTVNTTDLPLAGRQGPAGAVNNVWAPTAAATAAGISRTAPQNVVGDGSVWLLVQNAGDALPVRGDFLKVASRVYSVQETSSSVPWVLSGTSLHQPGIRVVPDAFPDAGAGDFPAVRTSITVRAQVVDDAPMLPMDGEYAGPWRFRWIEVP